MFGIFELQIEGLQVANLWEFSFYDLPILFGTRYGVVNRFYRDR